VQNRNRLKRVISRVKRANSQHRVRTSVYLGSKMGLFRSSVTPIPAAPSYVWVLELEFISWIAQTLLWYMLIRDVVKYLIPWLLAQLYSCIARLFVKVGESVEAAAEAVVDKVEAEAAELLSSLSGTDEGTKADKDK